MSLVLKYLKRSLGAVLLIIALLSVKAVCDLSLPAFTSNIVNIGIQQGGIAEVIPLIMRETTFLGLVSLVGPEDAATLTAAYRNGTLETTTEPVRTLVDGVDETALESILLKAFAQKAMGMGIALPSGIPEAITRQSAIAAVKAEYIALGMDVEGMQIGYIASTGLKMLGISALSMLASLLMSYIASRVSARMGKEMRSDVFTKVVAFSNPEMDNFSTASLITRSTNDIQQVQTSMVMILRIVFFAPILAVGGFIKVLGTNTSMAWIIGVGILAIFTVVGVVFSFAMPRFKKLQKLVDKINLVTRELVSGIQVVRALSTQKHEEKRFDHANQELTKTSLFLNRTMSAMMPLMMLIMNLMAILIVWKGGHSIETGDMQVGDMMAFIQYAMQIMMSFLMLTMLTIMLPRASVSATRVAEVLETPISIIEKPITKPFDANKKGVVEFQKVSFTYPGATTEVLSDISFSAQPGQVTAIIGSTGCGKSTIINLIPRFHDITKGNLLVDGVDVRDASLHELRSRIGYVPQKGLLFSGTIASNITYGDNQMSVENMEHAAKISQSTDFIAEKTEGYASTIAQGGVNVSGGQKQRLAIARAIAIKPEILIFDDSFSALDYKTDSLLRKALHTELSSSTVIIVAQRISTIVHADQILVVEEGRIVGQGTHQQLMETCPVYQQIAQSQLSQQEITHHGE
ncbi:MAG: ABC transporter [Spirochaetae bacterium HGW-Spirochaetae-8]|nr:MAG: ABC transporter [Spirochaetae bacterium HGW-Spirochaetae-8]